MKSQVSMWRIAGAGAAALAALAALAGSASGQNASGATPTGTAQPAATAATQPDAQIDSLKSMLTGSWKASGKEPATGEDAVFWMHIAPVHVEGVGNALYVEQCRDADPTTPYHQAIFQVYRNRGKLRLRTIEFRSPSQGGGPWAQLWLVPDLFPAVDPDHLVATLDIEFAPVSGGFEGRTPYPYPNADNGAVEMTSEMKVSKDKLVTTDQGYGPDGKVVWSTSGGSASPEALTWSRADSGFSVRREDEGLVIITLHDSPDGVKGVDGDTLFIDYTLWLADGAVVDASSRSGRLLPMTLPQVEGRGLIAGFVRGLQDAPQGTVRKLIIPPALGYGERGMRSIPGDATLYFKAEINTVQKPEAPAEHPEGEEGHDGHDGGARPPTGGGH